MVARAGGQLQRLTGNPGYDAYPAWSPDGQYIAFSSDRYGELDVFTMPAAGGEARRLTYHSAPDIVSGWTSDSKEVIFDSQRELPNHCIWAVKLSDRRPYPLTRIKSSQGRQAPNDNKLLFTSGTIPWWRIGYRGSAANDILVKDLGNGQIARFTAHDGNDMEGNWLPGGDEIIYLSDSTGSVNVFRKNIRTGATDQLTQHRLNAHHLRISADGSLAAYELDGAIYLYDLIAGQGSKLLLDFTADPAVNQMSREVFTSGADELVLSPDGSQIAFTVGGDIYSLDASGNSIRRLTRTIATEHDLDWSHDSYELSFVADSDGNDDLYTLQSATPDQPNLAHSFAVESKRILESAEFESIPVISPDRRKVAFVRGQDQLMLAQRSGLEVRKLLEGGRIEDLSWSPDGRYLLFTQLDGDWYRDIYLADSESGKISNITLRPGNYRQPAFDPAGQLIYFREDGQVKYLFLERATDELSAAERKQALISNGENGHALKARPVQIDFDQISSRIRNLGHSGRAVEVAMLGNRWSFAVATVGGDIWQVSLDGEQRLISSNLQSVSDLSASPDGSEVIFLGQKGRIFVIEIESEQLLELPYRVEIEIDHQTRRQQMFEQAVSLLREKFYDPALHHVSLRDLVARYRERLADIATDRDFYDLVNELFGEINASHLALWPPEADVATTAYVGIIPDYDYDGGGLRIESVVPGTPASMVSVDLKPGEKITSVGDQLLADRDNYYRMLNGLGRGPVRLDLINRDAITRSVVIRPIDRAQYIAALNNSETTRRRELVKQETDGRVGYIYLRQFAANVVQEFEHQLNSSIDNQSVLLLDLRDNIGGSAHDRLLQLLRGHFYAERRPRAGYSGHDSRLPFSGQIYLLVNEGTSSDAEIFAHGFQQLGLGEVLGVPTPGAVIGTETYPLADGSTIALPTIGWFTAAGENLEEMGVHPDVLLERNLTLDENGEDSLLLQAIDYLNQLLGDHN